MLRAGLPRGPHRVGRRDGRPHAPEPVIVSVSHPHRHARRGDVFLLDPHGRHVVQREEQGDRVVRAPQAPAVRAVEADVLGEDVEVASADEGGGTERARDDGDELLVRVGKAEDGEGAARGVRGREARLHQPRAAGVTPEPRLQRHHPREVARGESGVFLGEMTIIDGRGGVIAGRVRALHVVPRGGVRNIHRVGHRLAPVVPSGAPEHAGRVVGADETSLNGVPRRTHSVSSTVQPGGHGFDPHTDG